MAEPEVAMPRSEMDISMNIIASQMKLHRIIINLSIERNTMYVLCLHMYSMVDPVLDLQSYFLRGKFLMIAGSNLLRYKATTARLIHHEN